MKKRIGQQKKFKKKWNLSIYKIKIKSHIHWNKYGNLIQDIIYLVNQQKVNSINME